MDTVKRFVRFGFLAVAACLFAGCATTASSTLTIDPGAKVSLGANLLCHTEAMLLEFGHLAAARGPTQALADLNEKYGINACMPGTVGYIVATSSSPPKTFEFEGDTYAVQRVVVFSERLPDGSVSFLESIVDAYRAVRVNKPGDAGKKNPT